jgi:hypothetical protein
MAENQDTQREEITKRVRESLHAAEAYARKYRILDIRLLIISIVFGAAATVLTGGTAAAGQPALQAFGGWQTLCYLVAFITAIGTIAGALHKTLQVSDRRASAVSCVAKLRALELALTLTGKDPKEAAETYQQILQEHSDCLT